MCRKVTSATLALNTFHCEVLDNFPNLLTLKLNWLQINNFSDNEL